MQETLASALDSFRKTTQDWCRDVLRQVQPSARPPALRSTLHTVVRDACPSHRRPFHPIASFAPPAKLYGGVCAAMGWNGIRRLPLGPSRDQHGAPGPSTAAGKWGLCNAATATAAVRTQPKTCSR
jgi:hypothetical protein